MAKNRKMEKIKVWLKNEFEDWDHAKLAEFQGYEIKDEDFNELIAKLLKITEYSSYVITGIYKTKQYGIIIRLFRQVENQYGGYTGSVSTFITLDELIKAIKK
jgi:hypothetical protein